VRRALAASVAILLAVGVAGCTSDPLAEQYASGSTQNYISGDGSVTVIAVDKRGEPVEFEGVTADGDDVSSKDFAGEVLVINFWYAACPPCRVEAPDLEKLHLSLDGAGASFLGVNVRDQADTALTFETETGVTYPSVIDANDGNLLLAFAGTVAPNAVPTTLVIDKQGRVAARILGQVESPSALDTIIRDTIAEK
jgi:thiol-disulfide isomerase/thioredoxin